jgi:hypothetical protein
VRKKKQKRNRGYGLKREEGVEANHTRHPKEGIPWCPLCQSEGRGKTAEGATG